MGNSAKSSPKRLRICLISYEYPPGTLNGGIGTYTYHLAHGLARSGHRVTVITHALKKDQVYFDDDIEVHRTLDNMVPIKGFSRVANFLSNDLFGAWWHSRSVFLKIKNLSKINQFDIIEGPLWGNECLAYTKNLNIPLVVRLQTPIFKSREILNLPQSKTLELMEKTALQKCTLIASISQNIADIIAQKYHINRSKIIYSPLGIPFAKTSKPIFSDHSSQKLRQKNYKLLYVSRLERRKGTEEFIQALPKILEENRLITVDIVGKDIPQAPGNKSYFSFFKQIVPAHLQDRVKFHGFVDDRKRTSFYKECDLFIMPSRYESFGLVFLEAMAFGKPVIGTKVGGIPEFVSDRVGILVNVNDPEGLAKAVIKIFSNNKLRKKLGQQAFHLVRTNFSINNMIENTLKIYNRAIADFKNEKSQQD